MNAVLLRGAGAVSPAGWGRGALRTALREEAALPVGSLVEPGFPVAAAARRVPVPGPTRGYARHPRLRRASPIAHFALAACLEALGDGASEMATGGGRWGIVVGVHTGSIQYSTRFFGEVLRDPATASPLLFPETVFNAPASHIAAYLGGHPTTCTVVGDETAFLQALGLAAHWLAHGRLERCLVVGAEEASLLVADAWRHFSHRVVLAEGAGAVLLEGSTPGASGVELVLVTGPRSYAGSRGREPAVCAMRRDLPPERPGDLLVDSRCGCLRRDRAETVAWSDWAGARCSPQARLGQGLAAAGAWQVVWAWDQLRRGGFTAANISVAGANQQALGARLERVDPLPEPALVSSSTLPA